MSKTDKHRRGETNLRNSRSHSKSSESLKSPKGRRKGFSGNAGCHLFGGGGGHVESSESSRESSLERLPSRKHLSSLEKQISDKKKYCGPKETVFHNADYIKLKIEYANRLADEGRFQQALQEIIDLFVLKHQAKNSESIDDKINEDNYDGPQSNIKSEYKTSGSKSNQHDILTPGSLQYFITSLASATVGLGNQDNGFIRRLNNNPSLSINKAIEEMKEVNEEANNTTDDGTSNGQNKLYVDFKVSPGQVWNCPWSCPSCSGVLVEPLTLPCGHSYCKKCLMRIAKSNVTANAASCKKCGAKWFPLMSKPEHDLLEIVDPQGSDIIPSTVTSAVQMLKVNVLVNTLCGKYWGPDLEAVKLRLDANNSFARGNLQDAVDIYTKAVNLAPNDHYSLGNRSHVYQKQGRYDKALEDAEKAISFRKDWAKGYFRKGLSLNGMGRNEEAFKTFYECLTIEMICENIDATKNTYPSLMECAKELYCVIEQTIRHKINQKSASLKPHMTGDNMRVNFPDQEGESSSPPRLFTIGSANPSKKKGRRAVVANGCPLFSQMENNTNDGLDSDDDTTLEDVSEDNYTIKTLSNDVNEFIPDMVRGLVDYSQTIINNSDKLEQVPKPKEDWYVRGFLSYRAEYRPIDPSAVDASDFECPLCMRLLWQPITTPCGHTFCRVCLDRTLDHNSVCPMCKSPEVKKVYLVERREFVPNEFIESSMRRLLPVEYQERKVLQQVEINEFGGGMENANVIPIFVCTVSLPGIPCPLHVFEPRYRLMVRRAMESGTREFGMSCKIDENAFADYGTMLEIRDVQYFADGRSVIDTVGGRRFKVISRDTKDGYDTATVEFFQDDCPSENEVEDLKKLHDQVFRTAGKWFNEMSESMKSGILNHYGSLPEAEADYWKLPNGPAWGWWILTILPLDSQLQIQVLSLTSLKRRLEIILRILNCIFRRRKEHREAAERRKPNNGSSSSTTQHTV